MRALPPTLQALAAKQAGVLSHEQLTAAGFRVRDIHRRIEAGIWQRISSRCIVTYIMPAQRLSKLWAASLHHERIGLTGTSALEWLGLPTPHDGTIRLLGPRGQRLLPFLGCQIHVTTATPFVHDEGPLRTDTALSVGFAMAHAVSVRQAVFYCTWAIQKRRTDVDSIRDAIASQPQSATMKAALRVLNTVDPGVHSNHEYDFARECRRRGLPAPVRQVERRDSQGRLRYTDAEFHIDGRVLVVEIDGLHHLDADIALDDQLRANALTLGVGKVLRISGLGLRINPEPYFQQLGQALQSMRKAA